MTSRTLKRGSVLVLSPTLCKSAARLGYEIRGVTRRTRKAQQSPRRTPATPVNIVTTAAVVHPLVEAEIYSHHRTGLTDISTKKTRVSCYWMAFFIPSMVRRAVWVVRRPAWLKFYINILIFLGCYQSLRNRDSDRPFVWWLVVFPDLL